MNVIRLAILSDNIQSKNKYIPMYIPTRQKLATSPYEKNNILYNILNTRICTAFSWSWKSNTTEEACNSEIYIAAVFLQYLFSFAVSRQSTEDVMFYSSFFKLIIVNKNCKSFLSRYSYTLWYFLPCIFFNFFIHQFFYVICILYMSYRSFWL